MNKITLFLLFLSVLGYSQSNFPILYANGLSVSSFVPESWMVLDNAYGDLNDDNKEDFVIVLEKKVIVSVDSITEIPQVDTKRILAIYLSQKSGFYQKYLQSNTFIITKANETSVEPFEGIRIYEGILTLNFRNWDEETNFQVKNYSYAFKLDDFRFSLVKFDAIETNRESGETIEYHIDFLDKKIQKNVYNYITDEEGSHEILKIKIDKLKTIETLGKPYQWSFMGIQI